MENNEKIIWAEKAGMKDFKVNPLYWIETLCTLGLFYLYTYFKRLDSRYTLTSERLIKESGILSKSRDEIELFRVKDTRVHATFFQRLVGYGDIIVVSSDMTGSFVLNNMPDAIKKREQIRTAANKSREIKGIRTIVNE